MQTPTLALVVRRDAAIESFVSREYFNLTASIDTEGEGSVTLHYRPTEEERIFARDFAQSLADKVNGVSAPLGVETKPMKTAPPKLFSLSGFQKTTNRMFGWSAQKALDVAQALYENHKTTTYPRSDCEYLPEEQIADVGPIVENLRKAGLFSAILTADFSPIIRKTVFNSAKVTAHHAIIPTTALPDLSRMNADEKLGFQLIAAHYLAVLMPDYEYSQTKISFPAGGVVFSDMGQTPISLGWRAVFGNGEANEKVLPSITDGTTGTVVSIEIVTAKTKPLDRYTEGTLIADMEGVAKYVTDPQQRARLKETSGIGTVATRAAILEKLFATGYLTKAKEGKKEVVISSSLGRSLVATIEKMLPALADPAETAVWEDALEEIVEKKATTGTFTDEIASQISSQLETLIAQKDRISGAKKMDVLCPASQEPVIEYPQSFAFPGFKDVFLPRELVGRAMSVQDYCAVLTAFVKGDPPPQFENFRSNEGKTFSAGVRYNPQRTYKGKPSPGLELAFQEREGTTLAEQDPRGGAIQDSGESWYFPGSKCYFRKNLFGRDFTLEEAIQIVASKEGVEYTDLVSQKTRNHYTATLKYNPKLKIKGKPGSKPGIELVFPESAPTEKTSISVDFPLGPMKGRR